MISFDSIRDWQNELPHINGSIGFVPTMGALHKGHLSLVEKAKAENDFVLVSIFVNPTQFNDKNDLNNYPIELDSDLDKLLEVKTDFVLLPKYAELYKDDYRFKVSENSLSSKFCGAHRPGHFDGVLTVVLKLLMIAQADKAYFGEKDFQQYLLIKDLAEAFFIPTEIKSTPIVRELDGLAMSSRNKLLTREQRELAPRFYKILSKEQNIETIISELKNCGFKVDYVEDFQNRRLAAVQLGSVRLIDNVKRS